MEPDDVLPLEREEELAPLLTGQQGQLAQALRDLA